MPVYVDRLRDWGWRRGPSCHLLADADHELEEFARRIGMDMEWLQATPIPHYDLTADRRALAVQLGAIEATYRQIGLLVRARRLIASA